MRVIAKSSLDEFAKKHPRAKPALNHWYRLAKANHWSSIQDVVSTFANSKAVNAERVRFAVQGGNYRLIVAFDFRRQIAFVKFVGTHADYDRVDAATVSMF